MLKTIKESPLYTMMHPKSITICGASNSVASMGTVLLLSLQSLGFEGPIYPVHPREERVKGLTAYQSVLDLPESPELAILVVPTHAAVKVLDECGQKGIKHVIVVTAGFREIGGQGIEQEKDLKAVAEKYGIRFLGPNCIGLTNPYHKLNTTFMAYEGRPGFVGMASQSGSFVTQMFNYIRNFGIGFSAAFSVGNEAQIDIVDCMEYLGACPHTKVIGLYIEGIKRGRAFVEAARSIVPKKPIVALYVGGTDAGKRAGFSHTGSMAGPDRLYEGIFRQSGVIRVHSVTELFDACWALGSLPVPKGNRLVIQTHSGGPGAVAADSCGRLGIDLPLLSEETTEKLAAYVPHTASVGNPIDLTFMKNPLDYLGDILKTIVEEAAGDMILVYLLMVPEIAEQAMLEFGIPEDKIPAQLEKLHSGMAETAVDLIERHGKPIVGYTFRSLDEGVIKHFIEKGIPVFTGHERAARAMAAMVQYGRLRDKISDSIRCVYRGAGTN
jgi:acetate---CoA ligase (ADP-forming) subunit alpha